jgi:hypothetical protein
LKDFRFLSQNHLEIEENHLTNFFQKRPHLLTFIGTYFIENRSLGLYAYEFPLFGSFSTDFVIGDDKSHSYLFVEFESGKTLDKRRLEWRQDKVIINSKKIFCVTYDQLYRDLSGRLDNIKGIKINKF